MSSSSASEYLHGGDPEEQVRLSLLNDLLNVGSLRELNLHGGERILDVGSGLGQLSRAMARTVKYPMGSASVVCALGPQIRATSG